MDTHPCQQLSYRIERLTILLFRPYYLVKFMQDPLNNENTNYVIQIIPCMHQDVGILRGRLTQSEYLKNTRTTCD
ncbi:unnamed protein product [Sphenostylis stenocarpa]|uniref:Uncharacterized protein n=1 Tax=Sphenostylis stenocarpa TaxID=92480 RepID=A0AA86SRV8_9FABA|nr:unnamed protein product [Sphenostylis stenocarpa]